MKVHFDGLRRNATRSMEALYQELAYVIENYGLDDREAGDLKDKFDEASRMVTTFNCLFDPNDDTFNDLSDLDTSRFDREV